MDKQTLSNYGWLVIVTLVLAIMLALATPFGEYVGDGVVSVANGFVGASNKSMDKENISKLEDSWENKLGASGSLNIYEGTTPGGLDASGNFVDWSAIAASPTTYGVSTNFISGGNVIIPNAFTNTTLTTVVIPSTITVLTVQTFQNATKVEHIVVQGNITSLQNDTFNGCTNLKSVTLPGTLTMFSNTVFKGCTSLEAIKFNGTKAQWEAISKSSTWNEGCNTITIVCTDGTISI